MPTYAELSKGKPPSSLVKRAVGFCQGNGAALDLGAGSLRNAGYLLSQGFSVVAVDKDPVLLEEAAEIKDPRLTAVLSTYADFTFPTSTFDLSIAINSLQFELPSQYESTFNRMTASLKEGGVLAMTFFGPNDEWAHRQEMTFHSREEILCLTQDLSIISLEEKEEDSTTINGMPKHWHVFSLIARKT